VERSSHDKMCSLEGERCFTNSFPPPLDSPYSIPAELKSLISASIKDQLVYISSPSSYSALLGVSTASVLPHDDGSVYSGSGGLALLYLRLGQLSLAEKCLERSLTEVSSSRVTFLCGSPGPLTLRALLQVRQGRTSPDISDLISLAPAVADLSSGLPDELLYGRVGYLYCLLLLRQELGELSVPSLLLRRVLEAVLRSGQLLSRDTKSRSALMFSWHDKVYIGAAHGLAGILTLLLQARDHLTPAEMKELIRPSVDYVLNLQMASGNFPSSKGNDKDRLVHFCHGAPGVVHLLLTAHLVWGEEDVKYLTAARRAGEVVWQRGLLRKGPGLCHGVAGNGYALLHLYQVTEDDVWLYRAASFGEWLTELVRPEQNIPDRPLSLFEGIAGAVHFLQDLIEDPKRAKFPCFIL